MNSVCIGNQRSCSSSISSHPGGGSHNRNSPGSDAGRGGIHTSSSEHRLHSYSREECKEGCKAQYNEGIAKLASRHKFDDCKADSVFCKLT